MVTKKEDDGPTTAGSYVRSKRHAAGLSLRDVATAIGVSHVFMGEFERGIRRSIKAERLEKLAEVIPGFNIKEYERCSLSQRALKISLEDAPPEYQDLGLALARRIEKRDLKPAEVSNILRMLRGGTDDDE